MAYSLLCTVGRFRRTLRLEHDRTIVFEKNVRDNKLRRHTVFRCAAGVRRPREKLAFKYDMACRDHGGICISGSLGSMGSIPSTRMFYVLKHADSGLGEHSFASIESTEHVEQRGTMDVRIQLEITCNYDEDRKRMCIVGFTYAEHSTFVFRNPMHMMT